MAGGHRSALHPLILLASSLGLVACQASQTPQKRSTGPYQAEQPAREMREMHHLAADRTPSVPTAGDRTIAAATDAQILSAVRTLRPGAHVRLMGPSRLYDAASPAYALLQQAGDVLAGLPMDRIGGVDWMRALRDGLIAPRVSLRGVGKMDILDQDVIMGNTREMPYVQFPHEPHTQWLACENCHDSIFVAKKGGNPMTMTDIFLGKYCGVCHDKVAFSTYACERCHNVPNTGNP